VICDARFHSRSDAQGLVNPAKVVVHEVKGHGSGKIVNLLGEGIGEPSEAPHLHPHREILALHVASRNVFGIRIAGKRRPSATGALRRAIARLRLTVIAVQLHQHGVGDLRAKRAVHCVGIGAVSICG